MKSTTVKKRSVKAAATRATQQAGAGRGLLPEQRIAYQSPNPKIEGTASHKRYQRYMRAQTVGAALRLGADTGDIRHDLRLKYLKLLPPLLAGSMAARNASAAPSAASSSAVPGTAQRPAGQPAMKKNTA